MNKQVENLLKELNQKITNIERATSPSDFAEGRLTAFKEVKSQLEKIIKGE